MLTAWLLSILLPEEGLPFFPLPVRSLGICSDCEGAREVTVHSQCATCGSSSVVRPGSLGAKLFCQEPVPKPVSVREWPRQDRLWRVA